MVNTSWSGVVGHHDGRPDEVALAIVGGAASHDVYALLTSDSVDDAAQLGEGPVVDHRAHEVAEVGDITHADPLDLVHQLIAESRPHGLGDICPRRRRALLPLILERTPDQSYPQDVVVCRRVGHHEVLAASLADQSRVGPVGPEVAGNGVPQVTEDCS